MVEKLYPSNTIWVDPDSPYSGTDYPIGRKEKPVNNVRDAFTIADLNGMREYGIKSVQKGKNENPI